MKNNKPDISVIMVTFNHELFIEKAVRSVLDQESVDFELIIVDNSSTDDTPKLIATFKDQRIRYFCRENTGPSGALNFGIAQAQGKYISLTSGDDLFLPEKLRMQREYLTSNSLDALFSLPEIINRKGAKLPKLQFSVFFNFEFSSRDELFELLFFHRNFLCASTSFFRASFLKRYLPFDESLIQLQDFEMWLRMSMGKGKISFLPKQVTQYRIPETTSSLSHVSNDGLAQFELMVIYRQIRPLISKPQLELLAPHLVRNHKLKNGRAKVCQLYLEHHIESVRLVGLEWLYELISKREANASKIKYSFLANARIKTIFSDNASKIKYSFLEYLRLSREITQFLRPITVSKNNRRYIRFFFAYFFKYIVRMIGFDHDFYISRYYEVPKSMIKAFGHYLLYGYRQFRFPSSQAEIDFYETFHQRKTNKAKTVFKKIKLISGLRYKLKNIFEIKKLRDLCAEKSWLVHEESSEQIQIESPKALGSVLFKYDSLNCIDLPAPYIARIPDTKFLGETRAILDDDNQAFYHDEVADLDLYKFVHKFTTATLIDSKFIGLINASNASRSLERSVLISCEHERNYFHWLVECIPKLLYLDSLGLFTDYPLIINRDLHPNLRRALDLVNVNERPIIEVAKNKIYSVQDLIYISDLSRIKDRSLGKADPSDVLISKKWLNQLAEKMLETVNPVSSKEFEKIFIIRKSKLRELTNARQIEKKMRDKGFHVLLPEEYTFDEQVEIFANARVIFLATGAACTNLLFCRPGTQARIFNPTHPNANLYVFNQIANARGVELKFLLGQRKYQLVGTYGFHDNYEIPMPLLESELKKISKKK